MDFHDIVIKDKTGSIEIALWDRLVGTIEKGQTIEVKKCRVKLFREEKNSTQPLTQQQRMNYLKFLQMKKVNDEAAHISLAVGTVEAVSEVDPYLACPIASCNNVKMVTVKGEDDIYKMNCKKCHGTFRASFKVAKVFTFVQPALLIISAKETLYSLALDVAADLTE
ncbi:uncharacterized protein LOC134718273 [Mytilus trossulus]|uniref:uncharacterized protein LOC134718273 n=1 Tax=Mytilus trossulus TaxID=6551 RepID=UPI00300619AE